MSGSFVDKYVQRPLLTRQVEEPEGIEEVGCFGVLRGIRDRAPCLELRRKTGDVLVVAYSWIDTMKFSPTDGVTLHMGNKAIRLKGRSLAAHIRPNLPLISAMAAHRVAWVQELGKTDLVAPAGQTPLVESIEW